MKLGFGLYRHQLNAEHFRFARQCDVIIPDHAPQMTCAAPWHTGMAYTCGWLKAVLDSL